MVSVSDVGRVGQLHERGGGGGGANGALWLLVQREEWEGEGKRTEEGLERVKEWEKYKCRGCIVQLPIHSTYTRQWHC